jgi:hypothetical protein
MIIHEQRNISVNQLQLQLKTLVIFLVFAMITLGFGLLFGIWQNLSYLVVMTVLAVTTTLLLHKIIFEKEKRSLQDMKYPLWDVIGVEIVYLLSTIMTTVFALLLTAYSQAMSTILITIIIVILIGSSIVYYLLRKNIKNVDIPSLKRVWINGIIIAILFYSVTMLIRIPNVPISIFSTIVIIYTLVETRLWMEYRLVFHLNRYAVVFIGAFLILLSFPFNQGFNVISLYRGEFSLRMVYEKYLDPVHEFDASIEGDILFHDNKLIIANDDTIRFYNEDFTLEQSMDNEYDAIYEMNGRLLANKEDASSILYNKVYEWNGTEFDYLDNFFMQSAENPVFYDGNSYTASNGYVYQRLEGEDEYVVLPFAEDDELTLIEETEDYLLFNQLYPFFAHKDSFQERVRGVNYDHIAYDNQHMIVMYTRIFVSRKPGYVDPRDDSELVLYLTSTEDYFSGEVYAPPAIVLPHLFVVDQYHYEDNHHFLLGHVLYSTGEFKYSMLVLDDEANILDDIMLEDLNVAISPEYIVYNDGNIKVFDINADKGLNYRFIDGYGITFTVATLVTLFAVEPAQIKPVRKNIEEFSNKNKES